MQRLLPFLVLADIALIVVALFDCMTSDEDVIRGLPRTGWVVLILLLSPIGPIMWFVSRRAEEKAAALGLPDLPEIESEPAPAVHQLPPDDDPDFLRDIAARAREAARAHQAEAEKRRADEERMRERPQQDDE